MGKRRSRYARMERFITGALIAALLFFVVFMIAAGTGITWMKVFSAILAIFISVLCLVVLYLSRELLRSRSLWMSVGAAAIVICIIFSLVLNYPSPNPYKLTASTPAVSDSFQAE